MYIWLMKVRKPLHSLLQKDALTIAQISDALSHPVRVGILSYVGENNRVRNDICNKDLVAHFDYSQSSLSQHVKKLKDANLLLVQYQDKFSYYSVNEKTLSRYIELISGMKTIELEK